MYPGLKAEPEQADRSRGGLIRRGLGSAADAPSACRAHELTAAKAPSSSRTWTWEERGFGSRGGVEQGSPSGRNRMAGAPLWRSHWRGSPWLRTLKSGFAMTPRSGVFPVSRLPLPAGAPHFRGYELTLPRPFSACGGWWVLRRSQSPWLGFYSAPSLPSRPFRVRT